MAFKSGTTTKIQNSVLLTGVQDTASCSILNALVELGKKLRKRTVGCQSLPENEVEATLRKEFEELLKGEWLDDTINPLLGMDSEFFLLS